VSWLLAAACGRVGFDANDRADTGASGTGSPFSLRLGSGEQGYVELGDPIALKLDVFTFEMWIRRQGPGIDASTGNLPTALDPVVPLPTKGRGGRLTQIRSARTPRRAFQQSREPRSTR
jgi:hypothetical protein